MADRTSSSLTIKAAPAEVMTVIADLPAYRDWADGIKEIVVEETDDAGRARRARLTFDAGPFSDTVGLAYTWDTGDDEGGGAVHWKLVEPGGVVTGLHGSYTLAAAGEHTSVTYELAVDVRVPMIGMVRRKAEKRIIDSALKGLRRHLESR